MWKPCVVSTFCIDFFYSFLLPHSWSEAKKKCIIFEWFRSRISIPAFTADPTSNWNKSFHSFIASENKIFHCLWINFPSSHHNQVVFIISLPISVSPATHTIFSFNRRKPALWNHKAISKPQQCLIRLKIIFIFPDELLFRYWNCIEFPCSPKWISRFDSCLLQLNATVTFTADFLDLTTPQKAINYH